MALLAVGAHAMQGAVLPDALLLFPGNTRSVEYDKLGELRKLPNYPALRQQYIGGAALQHVLLSFRRLGITEDAVQEVVTASNDAGFYGIAFGTFSGEEAWKRAKRANFSRMVIRKEQIVCPKGPACVWFFEDSTAVFGTYTQLRQIIEVRDGPAPRITENATLTDVLTRAEQQTAPVIGVAPGSEILRWIGDSIPQSVLSTFGLTKLLSSVRRFSYAVSFPSTPHIEMQLQCSSASDAATLQQVLTALSAVQQAGANTGLTQRQFDGASVSSSGTVVSVTTDLVDHPQ